MMKKHQPIQIPTGDFQQIECSPDVGFDESTRRHNGPIHMGFRGKIADGVNLISVKSMADGFSITNVRFDENIAPGDCLGDIGQVFRVTGIG